MFAFANIHIYIYKQPYMVQSYTIFSVFLIKNNIFQIILCQLETVERRRNEDLEWHDLGVIPQDQEIGPYDKELDMLMKALSTFTRMKSTSQPMDLLRIDKVSHWVIQKIQMKTQNRSEFQKERETIFLGSMNEMRSENIMKNELESVREINRETEHCSTSSSK